jgi:hypothetical protein
VVTGTVERMLGVIGSSFDWRIRGLGRRKTKSPEVQERGFVLAFTSITLLVLTAVGGFAVDVGNWYHQASKLQNAADSASLAGAVFLPGELDKAITAATESLKQNGFEDAQISTSNRPRTGTGIGNHTPQAYIARDPFRPNSLHVEVAVTVDNYFTSLLGYKQQSLVRGAEAKYRSPVLMGSPGNVLGAEPLQPGEPTVQRNAAQNKGTNDSYWLNIAGGKADKPNGDRYTAGNCSSGDNCSNSKNDELGVGISNGDRAHQYVVTIPQSVGATNVTLQAFDGAYVNVGDYCTGGEFGGVLSSAQAELRAAAIANGDDPGLYAPNVGKYCTGDFHQTSQNGSPTLSLTMNRADSKLNPTGNALKTFKFPSLPQNVAQPKETLLNAITGNVANDGANVNIRDSFRKWATVYTFPGPGTYVVTASTTNEATGANRFSLRLGLGSSSAWSTTNADLVTIHARHHLAVYTNATKDDTAFYFAKLPSQVAGRTLVLELYDIGDVPNGQSVDLTFKKPAGASNFVNSCVQIVGPDASTTAVQPCGIKNAFKARYNGKVVQLKLKIPDNYQCIETEARSCWMSLGFNLHRDTDDSQPLLPSNDTTTWQITDCGNPLRLVTPNFEETDETQEDACEL